MIHGPEKFRLPAVGKEKIDIYVNFTPAVDKCRHVKMRIDGGKGILIPKAAIMKLAMYLGSEDEQDQLIPTKSVRIHQFRKQFTIKVLEDLKAGQELKFTGSFDVPVTDDSLLALSSTDTMG